MEPPGYDHLAEQYDLAFPDPFLTPLERHAVAAFAEMVLDADPAGRVLDIGCGTGHVTAELARCGFEVVGTDPSAASSSWRSRAPGRSRSCRSTMPWHRRGDGTPMR